MSAADPGAYRHTQRGSALLHVARVVHTNWYNGWGIHGWGHNWLYNVSGYGAVELDLADGAHVYIGSDEPKRLLQSILAARGTQSARHPL